MGEEMSGAGDEPAAAPDWVRLRQDYEEGQRPVTEIAAAAGMTRRTLISHATMQRWKLRKPARPKTEASRETIRRLKTMLQQRLAELETQISALGAEVTSASSERDIRAMNTLVRTLEKVLELERRDSAERTRKRREYREFTDAEREALAKKLDGMRAELLDTANTEAAEQSGGAGNQS